MNQPHKVLQGFVYIWGIINEIKPSQIFMVSDSTTKTERFEYKIAFQNSKKYLNHTVRTQGFSHTTTQLKLKSTNPDFLFWMNLFYYEKYALYNRLDEITWEKRKNKEKERTFFLKEINKRGKKLQDMNTVVAEDKLKEDKIKDDKIKDEQPKVQQSSLRCENDFKRYYETWMTYNGLPYSAPILMWQCAPWTFSVRYCRVMGCHIEYTTLNTISSFYIFWISTGIPLLCISLMNWPHKDNYHHVVIIK